MKVFAKISILIIAMCFITTSAWAALSYTTISRANTGPDSGGYITDTWIQKVAGSTTVDGVLLNVNDGRLYRIAKYVKNGAGQWVISSLSDRKVYSYTNSGGQLVRDEDVTTTVKFASNGTVIQSSGVNGTVKTYGYTSSGKRYIKTVESVNYERTGAAGPYLKLSNSKIEYDKDNRIVKIESTQLKEGNIYKYTSSMEYYVNPSTGKLERSITTSTTLTNGANLNHKIEIDEIRYGLTATTCISTDKYYNSSDTAVIATNMLTTTFYSQTAPGASYNKEEKCEFYINKFSNPSVAISDYRYSTNKKYNGSLQISAEEKFGCSRFDFKTPDNVTVGKKYMVSALSYARSEINSIKERQEAYETLADYFSYSYEQTGGDAPKKIEIALANYREALNINDATLEERVNRSFAAGVATVKRDANLDSNWDSNATESYINLVYSEVKNGYSDAGGEMRWNVRLTITADDYKMDVYNMYGSTWQLDSNDSRHLKNYSCNLTYVTDEAGRRLGDYTSFIITYSDMIGNAGKNYMVTNIPYVPSLPLDQTLKDEALDALDSGGLAKGLPVSSDLKAVKEVEAELARLSAQIPQGVSVTSQMAAKEGEVK